MDESVSNKIARIGVDLKRYGMQVAIVWLKKAKVSFKLMLIFSTSVLNNEHVIRIFPSV